MSTENTQHEVIRWSHQIAVTDAFAADIAGWKDLAEKQMREAVIRASGAIEIELEQLVDERDTEAFKYGHRNYELANSFTLYGEHNAMRPDMFTLWAVYKVKVPLIDDSIRFEQWLKSQNKPNT